MQKLIKQIYFSCDKKVLLLNKHKAIVNFLQYFI
jgi:hypothetical protein